MATRKNKGKPLSPASADLDVEDIDQEEENALPWDADLDLWKQEESQEGDWFKLILYRRLENGKGKEKVWEWLDENPGSHQIGLEFGGGKYTAFAILPGINGGKPRIRTRHFILSSSYTEKKRMRDRENGLTPTYTVHGPGMGGQGPAVSQASDIDRLSVLFEKLVLPILDISMRNQPQIAAPAADMKGMAAMMSGTLNQVILDGAKNQIAITKELTRELADMRHQAKPKEEEEHDPDEPTDFDWKEFLKEALETYGPKLLEISGGLKEKYAKQEIKSNTIFQTLLGNKTLFERVYGMLMQDPDVKKDQVDRVMEKLAKMGIGFNVQPTVVPRTNGHATPHPAAAGTAAHAS